MKKLFFTAVLASAAICTVQARPKAVVVCKQVANGADVSVRITNVSKETIRYWSNVGSEFDVFVTVSANSGYWKNISPGPMCGMGAREEVLGPGESRESSVWAIGEYSGRRLRVSLPVTVVGSANHFKRVIRSESIGLR